MIVAVCISSMKRNLFSQVSRCLSSSQYHSQYLNTLEKRGFLYQCTDSVELDKICSDQRVIAYLGFDATAPSLHVGSLVQIMLLRNLQQCGHKPIVLIGGGTSKVGDPSGKDEARQLMSNEKIQDNANRLAAVFQKFLTFGDGPTDAVLVNNAEWLDSLKYIDFLRDYGKFMSVNRMLSFESVKQRLSREQPLSFLEFNYMLLQAYDFVKLNQTHQVTLQLGGSDQWGNIVCGVELARKTTRTPLFGLTAPLISTSDGRKMGKSVSGAIWLDKNLLSEYDYWQFWRNTPDADVIRFLKLFTDIAPDEIDQKYSNLSGADLNEIKILLADEATRMLHGSACLSSIHTTVSSLYSSAHSSQTSDLMTALPQKVFRLSLKQFSELTIVDLLVSTEITTSKNESRRCVESGAIRIDDMKIIDVKLTIDEICVMSIQNGNQLGKTQFKLSNGKKKHYLVRLETKE